MTNASPKIGWYGPTHERWEWMLSHFRDAVALRDRDVLPWYETYSSTLKDDEPAVLLVALEGRTDPKLEILESLDSQPGSSKKLPWCLVLGEDWGGHRRTQPLPESIETFYWYELYDRLLPWLMGLGQPQLEVAHSKPSETNKRRVSPRVQRWIDGSGAFHRRLQSPKRSESNSLQLAMTITETATTRQLWADLLTHYHIPRFDTTPDHLNVWSEPDVIILDLEPSPLAKPNSPTSLSQCRTNFTESLLHRLVEQFPAAAIVVVDAFPRWDRWESWKRSGADILVGKPHQFAGVLDCLLNL